VVCATVIRPEQEGKVVKEMLSIELIGILGLLFALLVWGMVVTQRDRTSVTLSQKEIQAQEGVR
jgi:hypothetical protein